MVRPLANAPPLAKGITPPSIPPMPPAIRANLARTETLFAALAAERRA